MSKKDDPVVILSTMSELSTPGMEVLGVVMGISVRSQSQVGSFFTKIRAMAGGRIGAYQRIVKESRDEAISEMLDQARSLNATHVFAFRFDSTEIKPSSDDDFVEITAYGTAVRIAPAVSPEIRATD